MYQRTTVLVIFLVSIAPLKLSAYALNEQGTALQETTVITTLLDNAKASLVANDLAAARSHFQSVLKLDGRQIEALLGMVDVELRSGNTKSAQQWLIKAGNIDGESARMAVAKGLFYQATRKPGLAEKEFLLATQRNPDLFTPRLELGGLYFHQGKFPASIEQLEKAIDINSTHGGAYHALAMALAENGELEQAEQTFQKAIQLSADNPLPRLGLAKLLLASQQGAKAEMQYRQVLEKQPGFIPARLGLGNALWQQGKLDKAEEQFQLVIDRAPSSFEAKVRLGQIFQQKESWSQAKQTYLEALKLKQPPFLLNNLAWVSLMSSSDHKQALAWARKAVKQAPDVPGFQDTLAWAYHKNGNHKKAIEILEPLVAKFPESEIFKNHLDSVRQTP